MQHDNDWLIIANGEPLSKAKLLQHAKNKLIMVLDGAWVTALAYQIKPDVVLGDLDSIDIESIDKSITIVHEPDQDSTDLEKGLRYLEKMNPKSVSVVNATGWRMDHTLYNLRLLKRFHGKFRSLEMYTNLEKIVYLQDQMVTLQTDKRLAIALLAYTDAVVTSSGLQYDMQKLRLQFGVQESTSNFIVAETARIEVVGGVLLVVG